MTNANPPPFDELTAGPWDRRIRVFRAGTTVDTVVVTTTRYVVIVDTMDTPERAARLLAAITPDLATRQLLVVNTHVDWDHCWGNAIFAPADGPQLAPIIGQVTGPARLYSAASRAYLAEQQQREPRFATVSLVAPTITFTDALTIDGGDLTLQLVATPGHTTDHIVIWIPELRVLLAGDAAEHPFPYCEDGAALPTWRASLARMAALDPLQVIPCHGGVSDASLITRNVAYFDAVEAHVRAALAAGRIAASDRERDDLPQAIGFSYADALRLAQADPATTHAIYAQFHLTAIRAMLDYLHA